MATKEEILDALRDIYDPEIPINIVDLGLIYDVKIDDQRVNLKMTLTAPGCPLSFTLANQVKDRLLSLPGITEANVEIVWDPPWTPERINRKALDDLFEKRKDEEEANK